MHEQFNKQKSEEELDSHLNMIGFYRVPSYEEIYVSRTGEVWSEKYSRRLWVYHGGKGYPTCRIRHENVYLHRLLCETFIVRPQCETKLHVNHIDGNKKNYDLANLEWVTPSENSHHAYRAGLRTENRPVLLKDLTTGNVEEFISVGACAKYLRKNTGAIHGFLNGTKSGPYLAQYDLTYKGRCWNEFTEKDVGAHRQGYPRPVVATDLMSGVSTIYASASKAGDALGMRGPEVSYLASNRKKRKNSSFLFRWVDDILHGESLAKAT